MNTLLDLVKEEWNADQKTLFIASNNSKGIKTAKREKLKSLDISNKKINEIIFKKTLAETFIVGTFAVPNFMGCSLKKQ